MATKTATYDAPRTVGNLPQCLASLSSAAAGHFDPALLPLIVQTLLDAQVVASSLRHHRNSLPRLLKTDSTLVTAADVAIQALIARALRAGDPLTPIVAEELDSTTPRRPTWHRLGWQV